MIVETRRREEAKRIGEFFSSLLYMKFLSK